MQKYTAIMHLGMTKTYRDYCTFLQPPSPHLHLWQPFCSAIAADPGAELIQLPEVLNVKGKENKHKNKNSIQVLISKKWQNNNISSIFSRNLAVDPRYRGGDQSFSKDILGHQRQDAFPETASIAQGMPLLPWPSTFCQIHHYLGTFCVWGAVYNGSRWVHH